MGRLLILLLIVAVAAVWVYQRVARRRARDEQRPSPPAARSQPAVQDMVACAHCGVHLPRGEAVKEGALHFCGDAHRRLGPRA
jgi:uncharacterized protein